MYSIYTKVVRCPLGLNKLLTLLFNRSILRTTAFRHLEWITICCHSRPDTPYIESSVDLGIVWEVGSAGGGAWGTCENFKRYKSMI